MIGYLSFGGYELRRLRRWRLWFLALSNASPPVSISANNHSRQSRRLGKVRLVATLADLKFGIYGKYPHMMIVKGIFSLILAESYLRAIYGDHIGMMRSMRKCACASKSSPEKRPRRVNAPPDRCRPFARGRFKGSAFGEALCRQLGSGFNSYLQQS